MKTKIFVNRESLEKAIESVIRRAEGWMGSGSGECQLYGRYGEDGCIYAFEIHDFAGHNSWAEGRRLVHLATYEWFNWHDHEDLGEWLWGNLAPYGRYDELREPFINWLKENEHYDEDENEERNTKYNWWRFEQYDADAWEKMMEEWREIWLSEYVRESVRNTISNIENDNDPNYQFVVSDDVEKAEMEA